MKRDMDLIRKILLAIEAHPEPYSWDVLLDIPGYSEKEICYQVKLLEEAGLIEARIMKAMGGVFKCAVNSLTWAGHEFLEAARDNSRWNKAKKIILEKTGSLSFDMLKLTLMDLMRRAISGG